MTNYEKLVETLRWTANEYKGSIMDEYDKDTMNAAADAIERFVSLYEKAEMDATNLIGKLAQAEADIDRMSLEIDKHIATEIELSKSLDAANHQLKMYSMCPFDDEDD